MRRTRLSGVLALTLVFVLMFSSFAFATSGTRISNTLKATFNVADVQDIPVIERVR